MNSKGNLTASVPGISGGVRVILDTRVDDYSISPNGYSEGFLVSEGMLRGSWWAKACWGVPGERGHAAAYRTSILFLLNSYWSTYWLNLGSFISCLVRHSLLFVGLVSRSVKLELKQNKLRWKDNKSKQNAGVIPAHDIDTIHAHETNTIPAHDTDTIPAHDTDTIPAHDNGLPTDRKVKMPLVHTDSRDWGKKFSHHFYSSISGQPGVICQSYAGNTPALVRT